MAVGALPRGQLIQSLRPYWPALLLSIFVMLCVVVVELLGGAALDRRVSQTLVTLIIVVGLYIFIGNSGVYSFGHISFMAIGAYTTAILSMNPVVKRTFVPDLPMALIEVQLDPMVSAVVGVILATIIAGLLAIPLMRLNGLAAGVGTLALLLAFFEFFSNASGYTGGQQTLVGVPNRTSVYRLAAIAIVTIILAYSFQRSRVGLLLRATRDDRQAAASVGVRLWRMRCIAFILSAAVVGLGGALHAQTLRTVNIDSYFIDTTFITLMMLVVGGVRSLAGAVIGVATITIVREIVRKVEDGSLLPFDWTAPTGTVEIVLGLLMLGMLILRPNGITGGREIVWPFKSCLDYERSDCRPRGVPTD